MNTRTTLLAALLAGISTPALAQSDGNEPVDTHAEAPAEIVVTALSRNRDDVLSGTSVLSGETLSNAKRSTIGDTLAHTPGASSSSFGPSAARPVLRGLQGDRVRVLTDGIGSFDASGTSVDHAVAINPLTAERIEVVRGPAALLYGSGAIGGVVNVIDSRIPTKIPDEPVHLQVDTGYATAANERSIAGSVDVPIAGKLVAHADGSYLKSDDMETGGYLLSRPLRAQAAASADADIQALADLKGKLPNTAARTYEYAGGLAYIDEGGSLGVSVSRLNNLYGVPVRFSLEPGVEAEAPRISLRQTRYDLRAEVKPRDSFFEAIRLRAGYGDYIHQELEEDGAVGTTFLNKGMEGRLEFVQAKQGAWSGAFGGQYVARDFKVIGEEKFVPPTNTEQLGAFAVQQFDFGSVKAELGGRIEHTNAVAKQDDVIGNADTERNFTTYSASAGASAGLFGDWRLGINLTHTERAPTIEELYANGPHAGSESFEVGLIDADKERSNGAEATLHGHGEGYNLELSAYYNRFGNFLYQNPTGEIEDDLPVYAVGQGKATLWGFEASGNLTLAQIGAGKIVADALADYTRATIKGFGPAPLIPPLRALGGLEYQSDPVDGRVEVEHITKQDRVAVRESETPGYTMVNASIAWRPMGKDGALTLRIAANNLFDVEARRHASILKDYAPLSGRDFRLGASVRF